MVTQSTTSRRRAPRKAGQVTRRSLIHDPDLVGRYLDVIRKGNWSSVAAAAAGISKVTVSNWLKRGDEARALEESGVGVPIDEMPYLNFLWDHEKAEAEAEALKAR